MITEDWSYRDLRLVDDDDMDIEGGLRSFSCRFEIQTLISRVLKFVFCFGSPKEGEKHNSRFMGLLQESYVSIWFTPTQSNKLKPPSLSPLREKCS